MTTNITDNQQTALGRGHSAQYIAYCGSPKIEAEAEYTLEMSASSTEIMYEDRRVFGHCFNPKCWAKFDCTISTPLQ